MTEFDRPRRIVEEIRVGRRGRNRSVAVYDFTAEGRGVTRVELTTFSEPATAVDRFKEVGRRGRVRRQTTQGARAAADDLRGSAQRRSCERATIAGFEPEKAPRFGAPVGMDPARSTSGTAPPSAPEGS